VETVPLVLDTSFEDIVLPRLRHIKGSSSNPGFNPGPTEQKATPWSAASLSSTTYVFFAIILTNYQSRNYSATPWDLFSSSTTSSPTDSLPSNVSFTPNTMFLNSHFSFYKHTPKLPRSSTSKAPGQPNSLCQSPPSPAQRPCW
jgi:hypothetical protein